VIASSPHRRLFNFVKPFQTSAFPEMDCQRDVVHAARAHRGMVLAKIGLGREKHSDIAGSIKQDKIAVLKFIDAGTDRAEVKSPDGLRDSDITHQSKEANGQI
jgi:hypothetical protein